MLFEYTHSGELNTAISHGGLPLIFFTMFREETTSALDGFYAGLLSCSIIISIALILQLRSVCLEKKKFRNSSKLYERLQEAVIKCVLKIYIAKGSLQFFYFVKAARLFSSLL